MSDRSEGPRTGPVGQQTGRPEQPPVPRPLAADPPSASSPDDEGRYRTERVPYPLPPLTPQDEPDRETGQLDLGGYPPRVPGTGRPQPPPTRPDPDTSGREDRHG